MAFGASISSNSLCFTASAACQNRQSPTDSSEEPDDRVVLLEGIIEWLFQGQFGQFLEGGHVSGVLDDFDDFAFRDVALGGDVARQFLLKRDFGVGLGDDFAFLHGAVAKPHLIAQTRRHKRRNQERDLNFLEGRSPPWTLERHLNPHCGNF